MCVCIARCISLVSYISRWNVYGWVFWSCIYIGLCKSVKCGIKTASRGVWVARSVKHPALDFGSGHDLMVHEFEPHIRASAVSKELVSNPMPLLCLLALSLSLSLKNIKKKKHLKKPYIIPYLPSLHKTSHHTQWHQTLELFRIPNVLSGFYKHEIIH